MLHSIIHELEDLVKLINDRNSNKEDKTIVVKIININTNEQLTINKLMSYDLIKIYFHKN